MAPSLRTVRWLAVSLSAALVVGCGSKARELIPAPLAGQLAPDYRLEPLRGVVLARVTVTTQGEPGVGGISNPLMMEFREQGSVAPDENPQGLSLPSPDVRVWGSARDVPTLWRYQEPGLLAASLKPASYDGLVVAYPDFDRTNMPDSIPAPSQRMRFEPIEIPADAIVYIGSIQIRQQYSFWDRALDRVQVEFAVHDDYDKTVADFRARYPQFRETPVERRLARVVPSPQ